VDLVDHLFGLCREQGLQLEWQANRCLIRPLGAERQESADVPLPKSVFRAMLARLAVLCNEQNPGSVSPYGGQGQLLVGSDPATAIRVAFVNTPGQQSLELVPVCREATPQDVRSLTGNLAQANKILPDATATD